MGHASIIAAEGLPVIAVFMAVAGVFWALGWHKAAAIAAALSVFALWFFRNPERHSPQGDRMVIAPADGRVIFVGEVDDKRHLKSRAVKVSIFMNVFNVHINRAPETGKVESILYNPGKFVSANLDKASLDNEQNGLVMVTDGGHRLAFVQIAGLVARRIVCWVRPGDRLVRGQRFGMIMFGSRVDVYLPVGTEMKIKVGDKTAAGETVLGVLP